MKMQRAGDWPLIEEAAIRAFKEAVRKSRLTGRNEFVVAAPGRERLRVAGLSRYSAGGPLYRWFVSPRVLLVPRERRWDGTHLWLSPDQAFEIQTTTPDAGRRREIVGLLGGTTKIMLREGQLHAVFR